MAIGTNGYVTKKRERTLVLGLAATVVIVVLGFSLFGPVRDNTDIRPTTFNSGSAGVKAAYLLAGDLGYDARRWENEPAELSHLDADRTTLVLTEPTLPVKSLEATQHAIADFLDRGGRVVATGASGATLLPSGSTAPVSRLDKDLCLTRPEGSGELARAGQLSMAVPVSWSSNGPEFRVEERCGSDAVVVRYPYGKGEAIWWSSPMPLSNAGIKDDASLKLVLASLGPVHQGDHRRVVLFDEYLHEKRESIGDLLAGLPWWPLGGQVAAVGVLLVLSRGRRNGPLRMPVTVPRTSPLEFAESMGRLYDRAHAVEAPLAAARSQTMRYLAEGCGLSHDLLRQPPEMIVEALGVRIGGDWTALGQHLAASANGGSLKPKRALKLVQALEADQQALAVQVSAARKTAAN